MMPRFARSDMGDFVLARSWIPRFRLTSWPLPHLFWTRHDLYIWWFHWQFHWMWMRDREWDADSR